MRLIVISLGQRLVGADAGEVVNIAGLRHPDAGMQQEDAVLLHGGALGQLLMNAMERIAGLEGNHVVAATLPGECELRPGSGATI